jgi:hypothetical protein
MINDTINVEHTSVKDSRQIPRNKSLKIFHQNIRGLWNKSNELYCHLHHDLPHILCLSEHHLSESELQLIHLTNYSLGANYCRKTLLKGGVSIFVYRNLIYNTINIISFISVDCKSIWIWKMVTSIQSVQNNYNIWYINYLTS